MENTIALRDVIDSDLSIFFEHQSDPEANKMAAFPPRSWDAFTTHWTKIRGNENIILKTILYNGQVAGQMVCFDLDGKREVGYWLGREFWGKGIATQALESFLGIVKIRPLYGVTAKHNLGSCRVLEKCGFSLIGEEGNDFVLMLK